MNNVELKYGPNGSIELVKTESVKINRKLSMRQQYILNYIKENASFSTVASYLKSFQGDKENKHVLSQLSRNLFNKSLFDLSDKLAIKEPLSVYNKFMQQFDPNEIKTPNQTDLGEWIGVEIECFIPLHKLGVYSEDHYDDESGDTDLSAAQDAARDELKEKLLAMKLKNVQIKSDGSIDCDESEYFAVEFNVLYNKKDNSNLKAVCELLNKLNAGVNKSCGLHVHLDCRDLLVQGKSMRSVASRAARLCNALPVLSAMVPQARRNNQYCKLGRSNYHGVRYYAINLTSLKAHGTIEVRLHSGTTDFTKINNWVQLLYAISRETKLSRNTAYNFAELNNLLQNVSVALMSYVKSRIEKFSAGPMEQRIDETAADNESMAVAA